MRRKRLNHAAETLCAMFCGWRLMNSYKEIALLGSGMLEIDALEPACHFNGQVIEPLSIAHELHLWLVNDLRQHNIPIGSITKAMLCVTIELAKAVAPKSAQRSYYMGRDGMPVREGEFFNLAAKCESSIATDEANYEAEKSLYEQWPVRWPEA